MEYLHVVLTTLSSLIALFFLTKLMGAREVSQLSLFDYVNGITIGSIAAEMATSLENDFLKPLLAMIIYAFTVIFISFITSKSIRLRRFISGKALILFDNDKIYEGNLKKAKIELNELLAQSRIQGYFDLNNLQSIVLESTGKLSFLPKSTERPVTAKDLNLLPEQEKLVTNIIIDGKILDDNLKSTGNNKIWLQRQLKAQGITRVKDVFLATCDSKNTLTAYKRIVQPLTRDMFE